VARQPHSAHVRRAQKITGKCPRTAPHRDNTTERMYRVVVNDKSGPGVAGWGDFSCAQEQT
jgi:hypothetical protein